MNTKYYIGFPLTKSSKSKTRSYHFVTDPSLPVVSAKGSVLTANPLTANERKALTFFDLDSALEWCDANLDDFIMDNYTVDPNKYDWDNPVIIQNDFTIIPL